MKNRFPLRLVLGRYDAGILRNSASRALDRVVLELYFAGKKRKRMKDRLSTLASEIFMNSVFCNSFEERIKTQDLQDFTGLNRDEFYRNRKILESMGVLHFIKRNRDGDLYRLNLPAIMGAAVRYADERDEDSATKYREIRKKIVKYWEEQKWEVKPLTPLLKDIPGEQERQKKVHKEKKKEKREQQNLRTSWIQPFMRECCEEAGIGYFDTWTLKDKGCARNWLRFCEEEKTDPRSMLRDVCKWWGLIKISAVRNQKGESITLHPTPTFSEFFKYRREIGIFLVDRGKRKAAPTTTGRKAREIKYSDYKKEVK